MNRLSFFLSGASHGTKRLTDAEIERAYGRCRKKHPGSDYTQHLSEHGPANMVAFHPLLHSFMDYFDIAAPLLCARIVDVIDQINNGGRPMDEYSFWPDVQEGLRDMFMRTNFASDRGGYFPEMKVRCVRGHALYSSRPPKQLFKKCKLAGRPRENTGKLPASALKLIQLENSAVKTANLKCENDTLEGEEVI